MSNKFFEDTLQGLLEAVAIEKGAILLEEKTNMPAPTFHAPDYSSDLIDEMIVLRKEQNISQKDLATLTGNKQQSISRIENKENSPSLKTFTNIINALGYQLVITKSNTV